jgi:hypothetical protein
MRRVAGHLMVISGIVIGPPLWDEMAAGGLRSKIAFAGAVAAIATGLVFSFGTRRRKDKGSQL